MRIAQEEVFGPVLSVIPFDDDEDAIEIANGTIYGLAAGVWTADIGRCLKMARRLVTGAPCHRSDEGGRTHGEDGKTRGSEP